MYVAFMSSYNMDFMGYAGFWLIYVLSSNLTIIMLIIYGGTYVCINNLA